MERHEDVPPGRMRSTRVAIWAAAGPTPGWPGPVVDDLPRADQPKFLKGRNSVLLWTQEQSIELIAEKTGYSAGRVLRLVKKCLDLNPATGTICGFWACVPGWRPLPLRRVRSKPITEKNAQEGTGMSGALGLLFARHNTIEAKLCAYVKTRTESGAAPVGVLTPGNVHDRFIALCKDEGLHHAGKWPFGEAKRRGYEAVRRWFRDKKYERPLIGIRNAHGDDAAKVASIDFRTSSNPKPANAYLAYERVELDEHKQDAAWSVWYPVTGERFVHVGAKRLWTLAMRDVGSTAILSSGVCYQWAYSQSDVLGLVHRALEPPKYPQLMLENEHFRYADGACYPATLSDLKGNLWQLLAMDAHSTHFANSVLHAMEEAIGCHIAGERVGQPTARGALEKFFHILALLEQNLPSATGNRADSPARRNPAENARRWVVVAPLAGQLLDVICRNYNVTPSGACGGISPIERLSEMLTQGRVYRCAIGELRQSNLHLLLPRYPATAGRKRGKHRLGPLGVNLFGGRYVGPKLAGDIEFAEALDKRVWVYVQDDARHAVVVPWAFPDRHYKVVLVGKYSDEPHTLAQRRLAAAYSKNGSIKGHADAPNLTTGLMRGLGEAAKKDDAAASLLSGVVAFQDRYGRGDATYVDLSEADFTQLAAYAQSIAKEDSELEAEEEEGRVWTPQRETRPPRGDVPPPASRPTSRGSRPMDDTFGLL